ncbi:MAG: RsmB/NOP family class I SAM-dependent RNA methyltransferase [Anaerolineae bacterium]|jgi:16S rRNA C967 or C1407 C5-methylase (RsmB/RsmF family)/NOL1/NOP2/fmu family ribosome biogenesis protein|nr:RsmB/NOP family class I SAM-dependent RNA methyltransferase [Anaerolineae bacterium]
MAKSRPRDLPASPIPSLFLQRMRTLLGDEFDAFKASYDKPPVQGLRVNTLKTTAEQLRARLGWDLPPVPWSADAFVVDAGEGETRPGKHPYHAAGLYYLQDPSAMAPVELLDPKPGEFVLDLAAAPGGKSTHIAARLRGEGLLVSNEVIGKRGWELAGNLERWGATNAVITTETPERLAERWAGFFDAALVDAPCSGEGMFRKSEAARQEWAPGLVEGCAIRQRAILEQAALLVRPGGRLVYSTCTFAPEEDEGAVARFLAAHPEFDLVEPPARPGFARGRPDWLPPELRRADLVRCVRLWPHTGPGEGHFAALLRKREDAGENSVPLFALAKPSRLARSALAAFVEETFLDDPIRQDVAQVGSYLYALPEHLPDLSGLRYLHSGWWLGEIKAGERGRERFEPSHAFALAARPLAARRAVDLEAHDRALPAYLRGETMTSSGEEGWALVCVDGHALGWAKRVANRLKSHYPKGLRPLS